MKIKEAKGEVSLFHELPEFYEKNVKEQYEAGAVPGMTREPEVPDELVDKSKSIYRYRNHHHLPFLRRGLGPQMPDQR